MHWLFPRRDPWNPARNALAVEHVFIPEPPSEMGFLPQSNVGGPQHEKDREPQQQPARRGNGGLSEQDEQPAGDQQSGEDREHGRQRRGEVRRSHASQCRYDGWDDECHRDRSEHHRDQMPPQESSLAGPAGGGPVTRASCASLTLETCCMTRSPARSRRPASMRWFAWVGSIVQRYLTDPGPTVNVGGCLETGPPLCG